MLVVFSGGSGVGKNTVIAQLLKSGNFILMPTYTTRGKRDGESEGNPYCYLSDEEFARKIEEGDFYEYQKVHNHYYGTSKTLLKNALASGKTLLKDIDVIGTQNLLKTVSAHVKMLTVFLKVDSPEILRERLKGRGETEIDLRLQRYGLEQQYAAEYDYIINNVSLALTLNVLNKIFEHEKSGLRLSSANAGEICKEKVLEYAKRLKAGEKLSPVQVAVTEPGLSIVNGRHRYLASLAAECRIAKEIVSGERAPLPDQTEWKRAVTEFGKNS